MLTWVFVYAGATDQMPSIPHSFVALSQGSCPGRRLFPLWPSPPTAAAYVPGGSDPDTRVDGQPVPPCLAAKSGHAPGGRKWEWMSTVMGRRVYCLVVCPIRLAPGLATRVAATRMMGVRRLRRVGASSSVREGAQVC